jgi:hypothetical protein
MRVEKSLSYNNNKNNEEKLLFLMKRGKDGKWWEKTKLAQKSCDMGVRKTIVKG